MDSELTRLWVAAHIGTPVLGALAMAYGGACVTGLAVVALLFSALFSLAAVGVMIMVADGDPTSGLRMTPTWAAVVRAVVFSASVAVPLIAWGHIVAPSLFLATFGALHFVVMAAQRIEAAP